MKLITVLVAAALFIAPAARADTQVPGRSGYVIGYLVAGKLAKKHTLPELARTPMASLRPEIEAALGELAAGR